MKHLQKTFNQSIHVETKAEAFRKICQMSSGQPRRYAILKFINDYGRDLRIPVNRRYCFVINRDADFQKLIKTGYLVRIRESLSSPTKRYNGFKPYSTNYTYVQLTKNALKLLKVL